MGPIGGGGVGRVPLAVAVAASVIMSQAVFGQPGATGVGKGVEEIGIEAMGGGAEPSKGVGVGLPRTPSGAIKTTEGQVVRDVKITSAEGPCIVVDDVATVVIHNVEVGPCGGPGVLINGPRARAIRVTNSVIHTERNGAKGADTGIGVLIMHARDVLVQGNRFSRNETSVHASHSANVRVIGNYSENPLGPYPRGGHFQFSRSHYGQITDNYGVATLLPSQGYVSDLINLWRSGNNVVARNYLDGGNLDSRSECGIIAENPEASNNVIEDNVLIRTGQCGIGVNDAANNVIRRNKILDPNAPRAGGNVGIYVAKFAKARGGPDSCRDNAVVENVVSNRLPNGNFNDLYISKRCANTSTANNITGRAARQLLTPTSERLRPPAIPPIAYVP